VAMQVNKITEYKDIIKECFSSDENLLNKWHIESGNGLDACVSNTYAVMKDSNVEFFTVTEESKIIGYFGRECAIGNVVYLTGFFVKPEYRNKECLKEYWNLLLSKMGQKFYCGVYQKNKPAIDFLLKNNAKRVYELYYNKSLIFKIEEEV
jgi:ribosomal protein S18 acetylase RimI-like enzyme